MAGFFNVLGFDADTQQTGRSLILQAQESPDYSLVLIGDALDHPRYRDIVQTLRRDPRTADLPIGLMVREINEQSATLFARTDPLTIAFAPPQTQEDVEVDARRLLELAGRRQMSEEERMREAAVSLDALAKLASEPLKYGFYDLLKLDERLQQALHVPALALKAIRVLGLLGTPLAQRALVEFASTPMQPATARQAAAEALRVAIGRHGILLTRDQLLHQYDLYNSSGVLGSRYSAGVGSHSGRHRGANTYARFSEDGSLTEQRYDGVMASFIANHIHETGPPIPGIIGSSPAMEEAYRVTRRVARSNASVLLLGETGTGKELIASAVHQLSSRASGPFVRVNCGALSENLLESELFGHVHGAFTGAIKNRTGRFEAAHTGSIFLDEINSPPACCRSNCCGCCKNGNLSGWGIHRPSRSTSASSPQVIAT